MFYIIALTLLVFGVGGLTRVWVLKRRRERIYQLLERSSQQYAFTPQDNTTPVERIVRKTSRLVSWTAMLDKNIVAKTLTVVVVTLLLVLIDASGIYPFSREILFLCVLACVVVVILLPNLVKEMTIKKHMKRISDDLPFVIDMLAVCVQSGMTIEKALRYIADNTYAINPNIATLFDRAMLKTEVNGINAALEQLYQEVPGTEVRMLCSTLQQSIKYGSSIYQVLIDLSKEMRELQLLNTEEKVASLSAKMTLPMIAFIMFPLLVIVAGPGFIGMVSMWSN
ncbi:type II secretion system F family protein [Raoultella terrigena]|uniref:type II secretion system F family protein n=1 Tax=Raoultella terrigena TaxID=577 RepID=UPI000F4CC8A6|nr:type II secretion system F family protein [Raoultella terrigena]ROS03927.1 tight adherence protein C [Raoultella terrigena]